MNIIYNKIFLEHNHPFHPENRKRLEVFGDLKEVEIESGKNCLNLFHTYQYIEKIKTASSQKEHLDADTYTSGNSFEVACFAVGASLMAAASSDFALVRPPGHHAYPDHAAGFCLFNNIAIATQNLVNQQKKVLILDIDGHLGDGTEVFFYQSDKVLYWSLHQYPAFPGGGWLDKIGEKEGVGFTINVPLPPLSGDDLYFDALNIFLPIAKQFAPDIVAVSAGFDAHHADPLLNLKLSLSTYYQIGQLLSRNFPQIFAVLEGGYNLTFLPQAVFNFIDGINAVPMRFSEEKTISSKFVLDEYNKRIKLLKDILSNYWRM